MDTLQQGNQPLARRLYTTKQMGDACEMMVAAELTLAGIPALKAPDNWPGYDVIAQPFDRPAQRVSVKSRTFKRGAAYVGYNDYDQFDWLAIVLLPSEGFKGSKVAQSTLFHGSLPSGWLDVTRQAVRPLPNDTFVSMKSPSCLQSGMPISN
ncbi:hypothetical protein [Mesorhizobium tianshanense]|uniref:PD(D/E)XK endonuclease domain-containing protein n=1 Tax=Mesorhizobium tianshanense TaxID=39844 RepID=A0A562P9H4_9HYPH|nr:hypothetical protein [Mesorhizobium tianshanense]TWI41068.1 hypothetical protein IQ26_01004 [Mesorhizobium tianshanense]